MGLICREENGKQPHCSNRTRGVMPRYPFRLLFWFRVASVSGMWKKTYANPRDLDSLLLELEGPSFQRSCGKTQAVIDSRYFFSVPG